MSKVTVGKSVLTKLEVERFEMDETVKTEGSVDLQFDVSLEIAEIDNDRIDVTYSITLNAEDRFTVSMEILGKLRCQKADAEGLSKSTVVGASYPVFAKASMLISTIVESLGIAPIIISPALFKKALSETIQNDENTQE